MNIAKQISSKISSKISSGIYMKKQGEEGFVLVVSLVLLVILALFGMFATRMATTEYQIAGNERVYTENFYSTESMVMMLAQEIENATDNSINKRKLQNQELDAFPDAMMLDYKIAGYDSTDKTKLAEYLEDYGYSVNGNPNTRFLAVEIETDDPTMGGEKMRKVDIIAQSTENGTVKIIKVGLRKSY